LVDDVNKVITYLKSKGVKTLEVNLDKITGKEYAFFYDPDGLKLEVYNI